MPYKYTALNKIKLMGKKIVSYSLWGDNPLYVEGAIKNAILVPMMLGPDWIARFYLDDRLKDSEVHHQLLKENAEVIFKTFDHENPFYAATWRFDAAFDPDVDIMLSRDTDSRITNREVAGIKIWLDSGYTFNVIRDNPSHGLPMLAGMWSCRKNDYFLMNFEKELKEWHHNTGFKDKYFSGEQQFLAEKIWPHIKADCLAFDPWYLFDQAKTLYLEPQTLTRGFVGEPVEPDILHPEAY